MAAGYPAPLLPLALVVSTAAAAGYHGMLAFWAGGGGAEAGGVVTGHFYKQVHHRMGVHHVATQSEVPQRRMEIG